MEFFPRQSPGREPPEVRPPGPSFTGGLTALAIAGVGTSDAKDEIRATQRAVAAYDFVRYIVLSLDDNMTAAISITDNKRNPFHFSKALQNLYEREVDNPDFLPKKDKSFRIVRTRAIAAEFV